MGNSNPKPFTFNANMATFQLQDPITKLFLVYGGADKCYMGPSNLPDNVSVFYYYKNALVSLSYMSLNGDVLSGEPLNFCQDNVTKPLPVYISSVSSKDKTSVYIKFGDQYLQSLPTTATTPKTAVVLPFGSTKVAWTIAPASSSFVMAYRNLADKFPDPTNRTVVQRVGSSSYAPLSASDISRGPVNGIANGWPLFDPNSTTPPGSGLVTTPVEVLYLTFDASKAMFGTTASIDAAAQFEYLNGTIFISNTFIIDNGVKKAYALQYVDNHRQVNNTDTSKPLPSGMWPPTFPTIRAVLLPLLSTNFSANVQFVPFNMGMFVSIDGSNPTDPAYDSSIVNSFYSKSRDRPGEESFLGLPLNFPATSSTISTMNPLYYNYSGVYTPIVPASSLYPTTTIILDKTFPQILYPVLVPTVPINKTISFQIVNGIVVFKESRLNVGAMAGIIIAVLVIIGLVTFLFVYFIDKKFPPSKKRSISRQNRISLPST